jgi:hypothetical protein
MLIETLKKFFQDFTIFLTEPTQNGIAIAPEVTKPRHDASSPDSTEENDSAKANITTPASYAHSLLPPTAFLPGRLSNLEILERIFPFHRKSVLELVLQGCNGDLVKAIEQFLSSQETMLSNQNVPHIKSDFRSHPYLQSFQYGTAMKSLNGLTRLSQSGPGSAFTPFSSAGPFNPGIHSAFQSHLSTFTADTLRPSYISGTVKPDIFPPNSQLTYPRLHPFTSTPLPGIFSSSFPLTPYRMDMADINSHKTISEKKSVKALNSENGHESDIWDEGSRDRDRE